MCYHCLLSNHMCTTYVYVSKINKKLILLLLLYYLLIHCKSPSPCVVSLLHLSQSSLLVIYRYRCSASRQHQLISSTAHHHMSWTSNKQPSIVDRLTYAPVATKPLSSMSKDAISSIFVVCMLICITYPTRGRYISSSRLRAIVPSLRWFWATGNYRGYN